ncbi:hypothetical protein BJ508DRAFT_314083 [Ascobolus immersus RN42]|uniref:Uncharacterized protein n=1 Tax=Ascobolus immersus RN42 TaxID=1160509 RepID=A0A3N4HMQ5_ASCIM|nr:hypothetical protein BJ508DRAFT_314083 [Ascobolus immersus RN42]
MPPKSAQTHPSTIAEIRCSMQQATDIVCGGTTYGHAYQMLKVCQKLRDEHPNGQYYLNNLRTEGCLLRGAEGSAEWVAGPGLNDIISHRSIRELASEIVAEMETQRFARANPEHANNIEFHHTGGHGLGRIQHGSGIVVFDSSTAAAIMANKKGKTSIGKVCYNRSPFKSNGQPTTKYVDVADFLMESIRMCVSRKEVLVYMRFITTSCPSRTFLPICLSSISLLARCFFPIHAAKARHAASTDLFLTRVSPGLEIEDGSWGG